MPTKLHCSRRESRRSGALLLGAAALAASLLVQPARVSAAAPASAQHIDWHMASSDGEVDKAFAAARRSGKPVFLYWGAVWCPPCNQVKATLFSRADFAERSRAFVPVYVDGDKPGAQKVAARFRVQGYPTMIVFKPDGTEITRLPGEVDPERYLLTLSAGLNAQVPVKELMRRGLAREALTPEQWRLLAFYSWDTDQEQVAAAKDLPARLADLAAAVPADLPQVRDRLALKSLAARAQAKAGAADAPALEAGRKLADRILADPASVREQGDILVQQAEGMVKYLAPGGEAQRALATRWEAALASGLQDARMSKSDQVDALDARFALWKMMDGGPALSPQRRQQVLRETAKIVAATTDRYERQAVVPNAAHVLTEAGLVAESDELLKLELPHAVAPYYHMLVLAGNAKKRNDAKAALDWYEQAWRKAEGPATRIQWGTGYVGQIVELAPNDVARIKQAADAVVGELKPGNETFFERNQRSLQRMASRLAQWQGSDPARIRAVAQVRQRLAKTCAKVPAGQAGRGNCEAVFAGG